MKTLLVLASHPEFPNSVRGALNPEEYRILHRLNVAEAEPLLSSAAVHAIIFDVEATDVRAIWIIEKLRRLSGPRLVVVFADFPWDLLEDAYAAGASFVLPKPVRRRLLEDILKRLAPRPAQPLSLAAPKLTASPPVSAAGGVHQDTPMQLIRNFSAVLRTSLDAEELAARFLQMLRALFAINRAIILLPRTAFANVDGGESSPIGSFKAVQAMGMLALADLELPSDSGIAGYITRTGRILKRELANDSQIETEFDLLRGEVAVPIVDNGGAVGIAILDRRVTGEPLTNTELEAVFHLLEQLGEALAHVRQYTQVASSEKLLADVVGQLSGACVVVNRDLTILHANKAARRQFFRGHAGEFAFNDLPPSIGSKVYQVFQTGSGIAPFGYQSAEEPRTNYQVTIVPLHGGEVPTVMILAEERKPSEPAKRAETEATNLQQVKTMGGRLAHEINNAVMPLHLIQQEFEKRVKDRDLTNLLADSVKRIARRGIEMRALAQDSIASRQTFALSPVLDDAVEEARKNHNGAAVKLTTPVTPALSINGDKEAVKLALMEVILNAMQAGFKESKVSIESRTESDASGNWVILEVRDNGAGFTNEAIQNAFKPFYTTRTVGLGLGLSVAEKIISLHQGTLVIGNATEGTGAIVRIRLPVEPGPQRTPQKALNTAAKLKGD